MTSTEIQQQILTDLRFGPLDYFQVAADICQAPFRVRAELKALQRECLVREQWRGGRMVYGLTEIGEASAWRPQQTRLA
jgi:hypothetical protein